MLVFCVAMPVQAVEPFTTIAVLFGFWAVEKAWNIANTSVLTGGTTSHEEGNGLNERTVREFLWRRQKYLDCKFQAEFSGDVEYVGKTDIPVACKNLADFYAQMCDKTTREQLFQEKK